MAYSFEDFISDDKWTNLKSHYLSFNQSLENNISKNINVHQREIIREKLKDRIKKANDELVIKLKKELLSGNVVAVDGTSANYDLLTVGFQARIGIIAVNYKNQKADYTLYISEPFIPYEKENYEEIMQYAIKKKKGKVGISSLHITAIMLFKERELVIKQPEKYKMIQGDIFPYELKTGQGRLRGLNACLTLGRKILNTDNVVAAQTTTTDPAYRLIGNSLDPGEYIEIHDYYEELSSFLLGDGDDFSVPARFNPSDKEAFELFINDAKNKFSVGIFKGLHSNRPYVFYAPKKNLETMVNLLFADSSFQPIRGFPLLLDYADTICARLISGQDFKKQVEAKLARKKILDFEINEKTTRRR
ncbi:MAG: hypothetical protein APR62_03105 [Smithella sp. SDB]|nr:MAG: hypothetical protein APR62_03105 [Smithella sp. SDB]